MTKTTTTTKITKAQKFEALRDILVNCDINYGVLADGTEVTGTELIEFIDHEMENLAKRASAPKQPTKTQKENATFKDSIVAFVEEKGDKMLTKEIAEHFEVSIQKVTSMVTQLVKEKRVKRFAIKRDSFVAPIGFEVEGE